MTAAEGTLGLLVKGQNLKKDSYDNDKLAALDSLAGYTGASWVGMDPNLSSPTGASPGERSLAQAGLGAEYTNANSVIYERAAKNYDGSDWGIRGQAMADNARDDAVSTSNAYTDNALANIEAGRVPRGTVKVRATTNLDITSNLVGTSAGGGTLQEGDSFLATGQTAPLENLVYRISGGVVEIDPRMAIGHNSANNYVIVQTGNSADEWWQVVNNSGADVVGTDELIWEVAWKRVSVTDDGGAATFTSTELGVQIEFDPTKLEDQGVDALRGERVGVNVMTTNYTPTEATLLGFLEGLDTQLGSIGTNLTRLINKRDSYPETHTVTQLSLNAAESAAAGTGNITFTLQSILTDHVIDNARLQSAEMSLLGASHKNGDGFTLAANGTVVINESAILVRDGEQVAFRLIAGDVITFSVPLRLA
jgi:predicted oxidoreductase (fatty acid repression mutant protein)